MVETLVLPGPPPVEIALKVSARARRLTLRIGSADGRVTLTRPPGVPAGEAARFARDREGWLRDKLSGRPETVIVAPGAVIPFDGRDLPVVAGLRVAIEEEMTLPLRQGGAAAERLLKDAARDRLRAVCDRHETALGRRRTRLTLRDPKGRWGSCSSAGALMFSWRLILAPPRVLDYVAAHEVAHLAHLDHSPRFWSQVEALMPDYRTPRAWLKAHGASLHRYRFA